MVEELEENHHRNRFVKEKRKQTVIHFRIFQRWIQFQIILERTLIIDLRRENPYENLIFWCA